ncbi:MAG: LD-carboxypeptidase [Lachnoclostridium sp.]|jgi:muramoyltetrapeptide carboxypeptidase LdcA involved in peptidoglycan recycling|nr:LD-carboxypeptidase [Lachnoclostridium sp.]
MIYPEFIKKRDIIGVTAPSDGLQKEMDFARIELARANLGEVGFQTKITPNTYTSSSGRSSSVTDRVSQLMDLVTDDEVKWVIFATGGDFLVEILPYLDFDKIGSCPKWYQGYSDNTGLLFLLTTLCDMASVYGNHYNSFAISPWHDSQKYNLACLTGNPIKQNSFDFYESEYHEKTDAKEGYHKDKQVCWDVVGEPNKRVTCQGRLLGGCMEVLLNIIGTKYDRVTEFCHRYKEDGVLWYLESYNLDTPSITRGLLQMQEAGWFEQANGFVFGRPFISEYVYGIDYKEAVCTILEKYNKPLLFDVDIGHKQPSFTVINGAIGKFEYENKRGSLEMFFQ